MNERHCDQIAKETGLPTARVRATADLLDGGATVPFIARYRKEVTGSMDEVQIAAVRDALTRLAELDRRREAILKSLVERELLTDELRRSVDGAATLAELEDVYLPHRPKRRTRAEAAREKGLAPLAKGILLQKGLDPLKAAERFVNPEKGVESVDDALAGARDIIAELVAEDRQTRESMRLVFAREGVVHSQLVKGKEAEAATYRDYFDWSEPVAKAPGHRVLAILRGEREGFLRVGLRPDEERALSRLKRRFVRTQGDDGAQVAMAVEDGYRRLLAPSMETETRAALKERADEEAIRVFADNLRELLLAPPLGRRRVLALDPGFRTGAKLVCLDAQGGLVHNDTIYPTHGGRKADEAAHTVRELCARHAIEAVAIGNGTAGRETETFVRALDLPGSPQVVMVDEAGASVYSASETARAEFPDHDVTVRGAVSIGRRLMDPLAELVKIDPKAIGVGQYQHDVDQKRLRAALDDVVEHCVNAVGVEVNTASAELLAFVSGLGPTLARNIVDWRAQNGPFASRAELKKVPRLGPKAFEQCAGFLRIADGREPLDASAVHPERYTLVRRMATDAGCAVADLLHGANARARVNLSAYVTDEVGMPTLTDIMAELEKPGRDPRRTFEAFAFADVHSVADLELGMELPGIVTNVTKFGAFVDVGVHRDGLVHVSQLADRFVRDPAEVVRVRQRVRVRVTEVDRERERIALSMKGVPQPN
ncbi:uncharacterized protein GGQ74_002870 [Desulfobaculum xiamenense]|uniref:S1 motif domain-containing protein n=1 Tax=Desulfobaculum xiamenense TaxID=995050 RepID=A0A846QS26_9BACT|nr:Tex family protein [Desulfobaculum xiamenense]NJB69173.1 uncharacterized protein [Desulfobaculum xiamenense]